MEPTLHDWMFMGGLLLEVVGAFFLAKGAMVKSIRDIIRDTSTWYGATEGARNHEIREQVNSWLGAITLLLGLATQFVAEALRFTRSSAYIGGAIASVVLLCFLMSRIASHRGLASNAWKRATLVWSFRKSWTRRKRFPAS